MENKKKKTLAIVLGIFALVISTTAASFAFFTYSRTGTTTSTIVSGDIEFSFIEGDSATLANAFPVADSVGAVDTTGEYSFDVKLTSSSNSNKMNYNVLLVDNNDEADTDYFNNEQIKFSLVKNNTYVANTSSTSGVKLSDIVGFDESSNQGEGVVLESQEIIAGTTDNYKLRIWISDDVNYSNTKNGQDEQESIGKYNSYKYSLKVKVTSGIGINNNVSKTKAVDKIIELAQTNPDEIRLVQHEQIGQQTFAATEYRYYGPNPNNYVEFNDELWRIIGAMDVDDGTGKVEKRLKIIRANSIGNYSLDTSEIGINEGYGINEWSQADLMELLNVGAYYNRTQGTCYNGVNNLTTACDFSETSSESGLTSEAKEMIGNAKWYLGARIGDYNNFIAKDFYNHERGENIGKVCSGTYCNDSVERTSSWIGQVGLIYPSDYGYSSNGTSCLSIGLGYFNTSCEGTSWLADSENHQWTISPYPYTSGSHLGFRLGMNQNINHCGEAAAISVHPVVYLKSDIKIVDGVGTDQEPFILSK